MLKLSSVLLLLCLVLLGCQAKADPDAEPSAGAQEAPYVTTSSPVAAGRYLAIVGGCNDCHTERYLQSEGDVPEADWLTGSAVGWRGPWGTTYPANLRLSVGRMSEDAWVEVLHTRKALPPMPWMNVEHLSEQDARALYRYIASLGPKGEPAPAYVPPDQEPSTPYIDLVPKNLPPAR